MDCSFCKASELTKLLINSVGNNLPLIYPDYFYRGIFILTILCLVTVHYNAFLYSQQYD